MVQAIESTEVEEIEIDETEESEEREKDLIRYEISYYPTDMTLQVYHDKRKDRQLVIPDFQRNYVWDQVQASKLVESFLLGIPVPGVFLYKERKTNKLLVIDGQQRILSMIRFFEGRFDERVFRLKNVHPTWEGKTYEELSEPDRYQLRDAVLRATVVQQLDPKDDSSIYHIFERLNTGGLKLNPMEIRKCVYHSSFFILIERLNENPDWRAILGQIKPDKRLKDVELILRFLAMRENWENYEKPMKSFLNQFMQSKKSIAEAQPDEDFEEITTVFVSTCHKVVSSLGPKPFHLRSRLNLGVMDSVMTMVSFMPDAGTDEISQKFEALKEDKQFYLDVSYNTSDTVVVERRFDLAKEVFLGGELEG
ncbi:MAG: DUF262 domain-containing protein [Acidobacteriota bacterium]